MGTYLSTPVTDKHMEYGESLEYIHDPTTIATITKKKAIPYVHWGVVEMQGWRKSMEDSHVTQTNVVLLPNLWNNNNSTTTTTTTTNINSSCSDHDDDHHHNHNNNHSHDDDDDDENDNNHLHHSYPTTNNNNNNNDDSVVPTTVLGSELSSSSSSSVSSSQSVTTHIFGVFDGHGGAEVARFVALYIVSVLQQQLAELFQVSLLSDENISSSSSSLLTSQQQQQLQLYRQHIGTALIQTFHALDRMIDDPTRRDEILKLKTTLLVPNTSNNTNTTSTSSSSSSSSSSINTNNSTATSKSSSSSSQRPEQRIAVYIPPPKPLPIVPSQQPLQPHVPTVSVVVPTSSSTTTSTSTVPPAQSLQSSSSSSPQPLQAPSQILSTLPTTNTTTSDNTNQNVMIVVNETSYINEISSEASSSLEEQQDDQPKNLVHTDNMDSLSTTVTSVDTETMAKSTIELTTTTTTTSSTTATTDDDKNDDSDETDSLDHPMDGTEEACAFDQDMMLDNNDDDDDDDDDDDKNIDDAIDQDSFDEVLINAMTTTTTSSDNNDMVIIPNCTNPNTNENTTTTTTTTSTTRSTDMETTNAIEVVAMDINQKSTTTTTTTTPSPTTTTSTTTTTTTSVSGKVSGMLQRLLKLSGPAGQVILGGGTPATASNNNKNNLSNSTMNNNNSTTPSSSSSGGGSSTVMNIQNNNNNNPGGIISSPPSILRNGQLICNLKDHPIHAGATAIVAVLHGYTLTVANAGDSRAVLCRGYDPKMNNISNSSNSMSHFNNTHVVVPLSTDHKPMQSTELHRIIQAGGFVNTFGRINGNLNLSRSIGDLKYKQVHHLSPAQQMITAEPDIVQLELNDTDEFIIIGCDGIWDCLSNEKAVEFVATRIHDYTPTEIGTMMLNFIISPDPRQTQGIGGDNMTILIIDLQPKSRRWYRSRSIQNSATMSENIGNSIHSSNNNASTSGVGHVLVTSPTK